MKNQSTWGFAHRFCGKIWLYCGLVLLPLSLAPMLLLYSRSQETIATAGLIICFIHLIILFGSIIPTEQALKRHFDADGNKEV